MRWRLSILFWSISIIGSATLGYFVGQKATREASVPAAKPARVAAEAKDEAAGLPAMIGEREEPKSAEIVADSESPDRPSGRELKRRVEAMRAWAVRDPQAALASAKREKNGYIREQLLQAAIHGWAGVAPDKALAWAKSQPVGVRFDLISVAIQGAAETDPAAAIDLATSVMTEDPSTVNRYALDLVQSLVEVGEYEVALRFVLPGSPEWEARLSTCYRSWALHSPEEALAAAHQLDDPALKSVAVQNVVASWSVTDPTQALAYVESLAPGEQRREGYTAALQQLAARDPSAALQWIDAHPPSADTRDVAHAVAILPMLSVQSALGWTDLIGDPAMRTSAREHVVYRWAAEDPRAARHFVETSPTLSPEERVRLTLQLSSANPT